MINIHNLKTPCIEHQGRNIDGGGYSHAIIGGKKFKVHRLVAMIFHDLQIQDTKSIVMHLCDNRVCINPEHLRIGSALDNIQDCIKKGRFKGRASSSISGEKNPKAKLDRLKVENIRVKYREGNVTYAQLAEEYKVTTSTISGIIRRIYWI